ncbi:hypothetical protein HPP92_009744 [Vanilla planifolia]|uniref:Uncharacterized protein n=1 Tax=Vanilla planifolia TaxID=51239 RepID=A0A835REU9_VANPL|nr:hypothetical protein HPP92_009744 [Vanilla planifolia]
MRSEGCGFTMKPEVEELEIKMLESGDKSENQKCVMDLGFQEQNNEIELPAKTTGDKEAMVKVIKFRNYSTAEAEESRKRSRKITEELVREGTEPGEEVEQSVPIFSAGNGAPPDKRSYAVVVMTSREEDKIENEPLNLSSEHLSIVELRGKVMANDEVEDLQSKQVINEKKEEGGEDRKGLSIVDAGVVKEEGLPEEHRQEIEPSSLNAEHEYFMPEIEDAENLEKGGSLEHQGFVRQGAAAIAANVADVRASDVEESDEKKLWDQVLALRTIVGCKTKLCSSIGEELRALYLFTGVEPPVALKEGVDIAEMAERIQFLKSIVGMK